MNCEDFSHIVHEFADCRPMVATVREAGMSHAALCVECSAMLADAAIVSRNLVIAATAETELAPVRVRQNLLTAFAELHQPQKISSPPIHQAAAVSWLDVVIGRRLGWLAGGAVAIAAVIVLAIVVPILKNVAVPASAPPSIVKSDLAQPTPAPSNTAQLAPPPRDNNPDTSVRTVVAKPRLSKTRRSAVTRVPDRTVASNTGDYMALTYLAKTTASESGTVVRVELSRSALASLGLPMTLERNGTVKADVVIGDDGVAQAIRLVQ